MESSCGGLAATSRSATPRLPNTPPSSDASTLPPSGRLTYSSLSSPPPTLSACHVAQRSTLTYTGYQIIEPSDLSSSRGSSPRHSERTPSVATIWRNPCSSPV